MKHRAVAVIGALGLLPIAWGLVNHTMLITEAAKRAAILLAVLWVIEVVLVPLLRPMLTPRREQPTAAIEAPAERGRP